MKIKSFLVLSTLFGLLCSCNLTKYTFIDVTQHKPEEITGIEYSYKSMITTWWPNLKNYEPILEIINTTYKVVDDVKLYDQNDWDYRFIVYINSYSSVGTFYAVNDRLYTIHPNSNKTLESTDKISIEQMFEIIYNE
ncbi:MAG: hypothetical protein J1F32_06595 [Erysipelotrichales bacterium]|nr:hypothetical protein [Erysipelotrichales bacterium]